MGLFDKAKAKLQEKLDEISAPEAEPSVETLAKQATSIAIVGSEYPCRKDKKIMRSTAEKGIRIGSQVTIERYTYQGEPAYAVQTYKGQSYTGRDNRQF